MKKVTMPSTFGRKNIGAGSANTLDLNLIFWKYFFSIDHVKSLFDEYISANTPTDEFKNYLDFIIANLDITNAIKDDIFSIPFEEKRSLYCFKVYFFILSIFNKINKDYAITLPYGIFFNHPVESIERFISDDKNILNKIFYEIVNNNKFFEDNNKYVFRIYWENESYVVLLLAYMMRKKFSKIEISIDLGNVNEQVDFSFWKKHPLINKYIDNFENVYHHEGLQNESNNSNRAVIYYNNHKKLVTRLFDTRCYWSKCSFCSINSRFTSEKKVENLNEYAIKNVDKFISDIKENKDLSSLTFMDEAIEASVLIYFAAQLLKHKIDIKWNARSRISDKFTVDNCRILAESGIGFLGFGLESVNQRVLKLMNKREREYSIAELNNIFENCDKTGVNIHAYFMIGFPSETKQEINETLEFIDCQLKSRKYFTYSANVFYLMKGSYIYKNPEKYNIRIDDKHEDVKLSNINFIDNNQGEKYTRDELTYLSRKTYSKLFFKEKDLNYTTIQIGYNFWDFLDRTGLFYEHKLVNSYNPYLNELDINNLSDKILDQYFKLLPLFVSRKDLIHEYYNILNESRVSINKNIEDIFIFFVTHFKSNVTLRENINGCFNKFHLSESAMDTDYIANNVKKNVFEKYIIKLIRDSLLYSVNT